MNELANAILIRELLWSVFLILSGSSLLFVAAQLKDGLLDRDTKLFFSLIFALLGVVVFLSGVFNALVTQTASAYVIDQQTRILESIR
jgi:hypothetical protein